MLLMSRRAAAENTTSRAPRIAANISVIVIESFTRRPSGG
jgi:hypothetical protein